MLAFPVFFFSMVINLLTFLYAGMLVHRSRIASINQLVDVTPIPNWVLLFSKFIALVKMQMTLLLLVLIGGVLVQTYNGYYQYEIGHYLGTLYGLYLPSFVIWALVALWVQTLLKNPYLGMFLLLMGTFAIGALNLSLFTNFIGCSLVDLCFSGPYYYGQEDCHILLESDYKL